MFVSEQLTSISIEFISPITNSFLDIPTKFFSLQASLSANPEEIAPYLRIQIVPKSLDTNQTHCLVLATSTSKPSSSMVPNKELMEFTLFPKLATELRLCIWKLAMFPRIVRFEPVGGKAPAIIQVNRESRKGSRKHYQLCIKIASPNSPKPIPEYEVFINYNIDALYLIHLAYTRYDMYNPDGQPLLHRGCGFPGVGNFLATKKVIQVYSLWFLPAQRMVLDMEDHQIRANDDFWLCEKFGMAFDILASAACLNLGEIIPIPDSPYEPQMENLVANAPWSPEQEICIQTLPQFVATTEKKHAACLKMYWFRHGYGPQKREVAPKLTFMQLDPNVNINLKMKDLKTVLLTKLVAFLTTRFRS